MPTNEERREVARRLRGTVDHLIDMGQLAEILGFHRFSWTAGAMADRLADLVEPSCDRDALLALADDMDLHAKTSPYPSSGRYFAAYARRIREACGVKA